MQDAGGSCNVDDVEYLSGGHLVGESIRSTTRHAIRLVLRAQLKVTFKLLQLVEGLLIIAMFRSNFWISGMVIMGFDLIRSSIILRGRDGKIVLTHGEVERRL